MFQKDETLSSERSTAAAMTRFYADAFLLVPNITFHLRVVLDDLPRTEQTQKKKKTKLICMLLLRVRPI